MSCTKKAVIEHWPKVMFSLDHSSWYLGAQVSLLQILLKYLYKVLGSFDDLFLIELESPVVHLLESGFLLFVHFDGAP